MLIALMLGSSILFAQGRRNAQCRWNGNGNGYGICLNFLSDLTNEQKEKIVELESTHQVAMAELRVKQRLTFEPIEKNEIRGEMLKKIKTHRDEVRNLLTAEQQKQYDALHAQNGFGGRRFVAARSGRGQARFGRQGFRGGW